VSIAGGTTVIACVDSSVARRCILEDAAVTMIDMDESDTSTLSRACDRASSAARTRPSQIILVAQQVGSEFAYSEETTDKTSRLLLSGVPVAQVAVLAYSLYDFRFGECGEPDLLLEMCDDEALLRVEQARSVRVEAFAVIVRILSQEKIIKRIKERVWRPGGSLVGRMFLT
jgi:hypothetical protein